MARLHGGSKKPTADIRPAAARPLTLAAMRSRRRRQPQRESHISISFGTHSDGEDKKKSKQLLAGWAESTGSTAPHTAAPEELRAGGGTGARGKGKSQQKGPERAGSTGRNEESVE